MDSGRLTENAFGADNFSDHAGALKVFQAWKEREGENTYDLHWSDYEDIPTIIRWRKGGQDYDFHPTERIVWHWSDMLANLRDDDLQAFVQGPQWRHVQRQNPGIVSCVCTSEGDNYDHRRDRAQRDGVASWKSQTDQNKLWEF